jgi:hypothetical protein
MAQEWAQFWNAEQGKGRAWHWTGADSRCRTLAAYHSELLQLLAATRYNCPKHNMLINQSKPHSLSLIHMTAFIDMRQ